MDDLEYYTGDEYPEHDEIELAAAEALNNYFDQNRNGVFYVRQLEILFEDKFFHWVTNRTLRGLADVKSAWFPLLHGGEAKVMYQKSNRYYKRNAGKLVEHINSFSDPIVTHAIGVHGEELVLGGFARIRFMLVAENANSYNGKIWTETKHDIDFIFERDGIAYGVEVKNTLGYIEKEELEIKTNLCKHLGLIPVFAVRMLPKSWIAEILHQAGGFALIMKWQMYPPALAPLARTIRDELGLPVDSPRRLLEGTMNRFEKWHLRQIDRKNR